MSAERAASGAAVLRVAYRTYPGFGRALNVQAREFVGLLADARVELVPLDLGALEEAVFGRGDPADSYDVVLTLTDWLPQLISQGRLMPLDSFLDSRPPDGWPDDWADALLGLQRSAEGTVYGLPYHDGPQMLFTRSDLFDDAGEARAFADRYGYLLEPPKTWSEFRDVAQFFSRPDDGLYGCGLAAFPDGHNNVYDFLVHLWTRGGDLVSRAGPAFDSSAGVDALEYLSDLQRDGLTQPDPRSCDSVRSGQIYGTGAVAMMWNWCGYASIADAADSPIRGRSRLSLVPRGSEPEGSHASLSVYWILAVTAQCQQRDLAYEFIRHAVSPGMDRVTAGEGATACRLSTWRDPAVQALFPYYALLEQAHQSTRALPNLRRWHEICATLNDAIDSAYVGALSAADALKRAAVLVGSLLDFQPEPPAPTTSSRVLGRAYFPEERR